MVVTSVCVPAVETAVVLPRAAHGTPHLVSAPWISSCRVKRASVLASPGNALAEEHPYSPGLRHRTRELDVFLPEYSRSSFSLGPSNKSGLIPQGAASAAWWS